MLNSLETVSEEIVEEESVEPAIRKIRKFFKIGGSILLVGGLTTLIIGLTSGIALVPIIIGGYFTACGALNIVVKV